LLNLVPPEYRGVTRRCIVPARMRDNVQAMPDDSSNQPERPKSPGALGSFVQAESMVQLALAIPVGTFVGMGLGYLLDRHFHQHWMTVTGLFLGAAGGFIQIFTALSRMSKRGDQ
jgi:ATP synthase protein I